MELNYIKEFVVLAEIGNYLEAADQLFIAQSSLSRHIKSMEDELGTSLFHRGRKISLTEFGKIFLPYARQIVELQQSYQQELFEFKRSIQGTLSIGSIPSMAQYHIIDMLFRFEQENPNYTLNLTDGDSIQLMDMITDERLELAFVRSSKPLSDQFVQIEYAQDSLAAVVPAGHPLADKEALQLKDLASETLLMLSKDTFMYQMCVRACLSAGFQPRIGYTGRRGENLLAMVEKGAGIALLTQAPIRRPDNQNIRIIEIIPKITTSISLIYKNGRRLSPAAKRFIALIKDGQ